MDSKNSIKTWRGLLAIFATLLPGLGAQATSCSVVVNQIDTGGIPVNYSTPASGPGGAPIIAFTSNVLNQSATYLATCADPTCVGQTFRVISLSSNFFTGPGLVVNPLTGMPTILSNQFSRPYRYDCTEPTCASTLSSVVPINSSISRQSRAVVLADGRITTAYVPTSSVEHSLDLILITCPDLTCNNPVIGKVFDAPDSSNTHYNDLELAQGPDGSITVAYLQSETGSNALSSYEIVRCETPSCAIKTRNVISGPINNTSPVRVGMTLRHDGRPLAIDAQLGHRVVMDCNDIACSSYVARPIPGADTDIPHDVGIDLLNRPMISFSGPNKIGFHICLDSNCTQFESLSTSTPVEHINIDDLSMSRDKNPLLSFSDLFTQKLYLATCEFPDALHHDSFE